MAEINTLASLKTYFAAGGSHTLLPNTDEGSEGIYTLDGDLVAELDLTLVPTDDIVIDGAGLYTVLFKDATFNVGQAAGDYTVRFRNCDTVEVYADTAATVYNSYYCQYDESVANGFNVRDGNGFPVRVQHHHCQANDNARDGFSMLSAGGTTKAISIMTLSDCLANDNGAAANDQGITAHKSYQLIRAIRCEVAGNAGQGVAMTSGSCIMAEECLFDGNATVGDVQQVAIEGGIGYFDNCLWKNTKAATFGLTTSVGASIALNGCRFEGNEANSHAIFIGSGTLFLSVNKTVFTGYTGNNIYAISLGTMTNEFVMLIDGNVFYNCRRFLNIQNVERLRCKNNIFAGATQYAIVGTDNLYSYNLGMTGNNLFYDNAANFYNASHHSVVDSDLTAVNPNLDTNHLPRSLYLRTAGSPAVVDTDGNTVYHNAIGIYDISRGGILSGGRLFRGLL
jgi:hypothetical protein